MRFAVLGPLSVSLDAGPASVGGRKQRTLLAVLLLHANAFVSRGELVDALWEERPPTSAAESLDTYVYRLRKVLGADRLLREVGGPSSYIPAFFSCNGSDSNGFYCDPAIDREMQRAELLDPTDPAKSGALWAAIDRQLTKNAEWVSTVASREVELTSPRLRNYEYNPVWGFLADQAWVH